MRSSRLLLVISGVFLLSGETKVRFSPMPGRAWPWPDGQEGQDLLIRGRASLEVRTQEQIKCLFVCQPPRVAVQPAVTC